MIRFTVVIKVAKNEALEHRYPMPFHTIKVRSYLMMPVSMIWVWILGVIFMVG